MACAAFPGALRGMAIMYLTNTLDGQYIGFVGGTHPAHLTAPRLSATYKDAKGAGFPAPP